MGYLVTNTFQNLGGLSCCDAVGLSLWTTYPYQAYIVCTACLPVWKSPEGKQLWSKTRLWYLSTCEPKPDTRLAFAESYKAKQERSTNWATRHTAGVLLNRGGYHIRSSRRLLDRGKGKNSGACNKWGPPNFRGRTGQTHEWWDLVFAPHWT